VSAPKSPPAGSPLSHKKHQGRLAGSAAGAVGLPRRPDEDDTALVVRRLKDAYGFDMPDAAARYIAEMHSTHGEKQVEAGRSDNKHWQPNSKGVSMRKVLGRDVTAVAGQVVKHAMRGSRSAGSFDGDFYSGGGLGTITGMDILITDRLSHTCSGCSATGRLCTARLADVCGDSALVRWHNGNERFYYVGRTPWRKNATGEDTDNARAIRCLVLHEA